MELCHIAPRENWKEIAEEVGFNFHTMYGEPYWNEARAYRFSLTEIETGIEDPVTELHALCLDAVGRILDSEELMSRMGLPREHWDYVLATWQNGQPSLYGRMDLAYDGRGPAKLLEYNADTPTSLFESTSFQWRWLEDQIAAGVLPEGADQFNGTFEAITERFREIFPNGETVWFTSVPNNTEDYGTTETLAWAAKEAGLNPLYLTLDHLGITPEGQFADEEGYVVDRLFKLYPWENMLAEPFADNLMASGCMLIEPAWKALISNKAILPMLWRFNEGHPNLLPAFFEDEFSPDAPQDSRDRLARAEPAFAQGRVSKPLFSREGSSVDITDGAGAVLARAQDRSYDLWPKVVQAYHALPEFEGAHPVIGAWVAGEACSGMGLREDKSLITQNLSQFVPHFIEG